MCHQLGVETFLTYRHRDFICASLTTGYVVIVGMLAVETYSLAILGHGSKPCD